MGCSTENDYVKLKFKIDTDMLLMIQKEIIDRRCHSALGSAKANNKYMKKMQQKIPHFCCIRMSILFMGGLYHKNCVWMCFNKLKLYLILLKILLKIM